MAAAAQEALVSRAGKALTRVAIGGNVALTKIENGPAIVTKSSGNDAGGRLSVVVRGGPVFENQYNSGVSHFARRMAFRDNLITSTWRMDRDLTLAGIDQEGFEAGLLARKYLTYTLSGGSETVGQTASVDKLLQSILFPRFHFRDLDNLRNIIGQDEINAIWNNPMGYTRNLLTEVAFAGQPLGNPMYCPAHNIGAIGSSTLWDWWESNVSSQDLLIVASGVDHDYLVDNVVESPFLQMSNIANTKLAAAPTSQYVGGTRNKIHHKSMERDEEWEIMDNFVAVGFKAPGCDNSKDRVAATMIVSALRTALGGASAFQYADASSQVSYEPFENVGLISVVMRNGQQSCVDTVRKTIEGLGSVSADQLTTLKKAAKVELWTQSQNRAFAPELLAGDVLFAPTVPFILDGVEGQNKLVDSVTAADIARLAKEMAQNPTLVSNGGDKAALSIKF